VRELRQAWHPEKAEIKRLEERVAQLLADQQAILVATMDIRWSRDQQGRLTNGQHVLYEPRLR
jgi:hypothetical protein